MLRGWVAAAAAHLRPRSRTQRFTAWHALALYTLTALAATWPLARGLGRDVPWDLGDPLFVMWAIAWDCQQLIAILAGDLSRVGTFFDANIFHPAALTLAYSEHFLAQAIQVLPVYALTENPILCYNVLFLSTFVLSGLGAFLFVREVTGNTYAGFVAGLLFAFAPYRIPQSAHLQVLSSHWMPFALYGLRRYVVSIRELRGGRLRPLAGATVAVIAQNLSCGYYLMFFSPFAAAYVVWETAVRGVWRQPRVWVQLACAATVVLLLTLPFLVPYAQVRRLTMLERTPGEVLRYSADVYSYATTYPAQAIWGEIAQAFPKAEGELFPGAVTLVLALAGILLWRASDPGRPPLEVRDRWPILTALVVGAAAAHLAAAGAALVFRRVTIDAGLFELSISDITRVLLSAAVLAALAVFVSPGVRRALSAFVRGPGFFVVALLASAWLSLGPLPRALGRPLDVAAPYQLLYDFVPGFDGLRVPARFAMIVVLMLAILGGLGTAVLVRWRAGRLTIPALAALFLAESLVLPFPLNRVSAREGFNPPEARVYRPARAPAVYRHLARHPANLVLAELPLGYPEFDLRAMFYSAVHWRPLVNGYSGFFPTHYAPLSVALSDVPRHAEAALDALRAVGATHVLVHETAYVGNQGALTSAVLISHGAVELFRDGSDALLELPSAVSR